MGTMGREQLVIRSGQFRCWNHADYSRSQSKVPFQTEMRRHFFSHKMFNQRNSHPQNEVEATQLNIFTKILEASMDMGRKLIKVLNLDEHQGSY